MESFVILMETFGSKAECKRKHVHVQPQAVTKMSEDRENAYTKYASEKYYRALKQLEDMTPGMAATLEFGSLRTRLWGCGSLARRD